MLSVKRTQEVLNDKTITYEKAEKIRDGFYVLGGVIFKSWIEKRKKEKLKNKDNANKNTKNSE